MYAVSGVIWDISIIFFSEKGCSKKSEMKTNILLISEGCLGEGGRSKDSKLYLLCVNTGIYDAIKSDACACANVGLKR